MISLLSRTYQLDQSILTIYSVGERDSRQQERDFSHSRAFIVNEVPRHRHFCGNRYYNKKICTTLFI